MELYDLTTLLDVLRVQKTSVPKIWTPLYTRQINFDTPTITWDKVYDDDRHLAPFVIPQVQGRPQRLQGYTTEQFAPAYIKIKDAVDVNMHVARMPGETPITGSLSIEQRRDAVVADLLRRQKIKIENRWEWMAAKGIVDGGVTIKGEDYPEVYVDFRRDPSLTGVLTGGARWSQATAKPLDDLKLMRQRVHAKSGARITKHIFGAEAWDKFAARVDLKELMNLNYGGLDVKVTRMWDGFEGMEYMGRISGLNGAGAIECWVNTAMFIDPDTGVEDYYMPQNKVVGISDLINGVRCFGAINDARAGYRALPIFTKNWINEDPSVEYLLAQSAPLFVPRNPDASYVLDVGT